MTTTPLLPTLPGTAIAARASGPKRARRGAGLAVGDVLPPVVWRRACRSPFVWGAVRSRAAVQAQLLAEFSEGIVRQSAAETSALGVRCPHCNVLGFEPRAVAASAAARSYDDDERAQAAASARCCAETSSQPPRSDSCSAGARDGAPTSHFEDPGSLDALRCKLLSFEGGGGRGRGSPNPADDDDDDHATFASGVGDDDPLGFLDDNTDNAPTADGASARSSGDGGSDDDEPDPNGETLPTPTATPTAAAGAAGGDDASFASEHHHHSRRGHDAPHYSRRAPPELPARRRDGCRRTADDDTAAPAEHEHDATFLFVEDGTTSHAAASPSYAPRPDDAPFAESFVQGVLVRGGSPCLRDAPRALAAY